MRITAQNRLRQINALMQSNRNEREPKPCTRKHRRHTYEIAERPFVRFVSRWWQTCGVCGTRRLVVPVLTEGPNGREICGIQNADSWDPLRQCWTVRGLVQKPKPKSKPRPDDSWRQW